MKQPSKHHTRLPGRVSLLITGLSIIVVTALVTYGPIAQDPAYHNFADNRTVFAVPNFWNVVSNLPFLLVGLAGLIRCIVMTDYPGGAESKMGYLLFFAGITFTGFGSAYYHFQPGNWGLFWDRLAMALSFMAFLSIVIGSFISPGSGRRLLLPLVFFGLFSVVYWIVTEQYGVSDLRLYAITQFLPMLLIAIIICSRKSDAIQTVDILIIGATYGVAKVLESLDTTIYQIIPISGHSLKHLAAAFSAYWLLVVLGKHKKTLPNEEKPCNTL